MMTKDEAIEKLISAGHDMKNLIEKLQEENAFLTDTIVKHNLGKIVSERRTLLAEED